MVFKGLGNNVDKTRKAHQPSIAQQILMLICAFNRKKKNPLENKIFCQLSYTLRSYLSHEYCGSGTVNLYSRCARTFISVAVCFKGCDQS